MQCFMRELLTQSGQLLVGEIKVEIVIGPSTLLHDNDRIIVILTLFIYTIHISEKEILNYL